MSSEPMPDQHQHQHQHQRNAHATAVRSILPTDMISVEEARSRILERFAPTPPTSVPLLDALGLTLAEDVRARFDIPPLANTGMDGYAVRHQDTEGATYDAPTTLEVIGYLPAGSVYDGEVGPGQAVRIMTGAPIPAGADAVVPFEETDEYDSHEDSTAGRTPAPDPRSWQQNPRTAVRVDVAAAEGANIRPTGEDVRAGELVLPQGTLLGPAQIGVLASLGLDTAPVHRRPVVAILSTGDELLRPGEPPQPGKIYDANAFGLAAAVSALGATPLVLDVARDTVEALTARIREGIATADVLITSAGVSRGDFDIVKNVLAAEGEVGFWTVRMKPGKPLAFGTLAAPSPHSSALTPPPSPTPSPRGGEGGGEDSPSGRVVPHLGLPGNPVSAMMTFELFGRAAIYKLLGRLERDPDAWQRPTVRGVTLDRIVNTDGRRFYARCIASQDEQGQWSVRLTGPQGSGVLTSMSLANAYAICPEDTPAIEVGETCEIMLVDR